MFWLLLLFRDSAIIFQYLSGVWVFSLHLSLHFICSTGGLKAIVFIQRHFLQKMYCILPRKSQILHLTVFLDDLFQIQLPERTGLFRISAFGLEKEKQNCGPCYGFLSSIYNICKWLGREVKRRRGKNKTHPPSIGHFKCSHCLINTNMPWQTQARLESLNFSCKRENLSLTLWVQHLRPTMRQLWGEKAYLASKFTIWLIYHDARMLTKLSPQIAVQTPLCILPCLKDFITVEVFGSDRYLKQAGKPNINKRKKLFIWISGS